LIGKAYEQLDTSQVSKQYLDRETDHIAEGQDSRQQLQWAWQERNRSNLNCLLNEHLRDAFPLPLAR